MVLEWLPYILVCSGPTFDLQPVSSNRDYNAAELKWSYC